MQKKTSATRILWVMGLVAGLGFLFFVGRNQSTTPETMVVTMPSPVPTATPTAQVSPDGLVTVTLKKAQDTTTILVNDRVVATRTVGANETISLPFNAWSPNDAYFFLQDTTPSGTEYLVYTATGKPIAKDTTVFMVADLFAKAYPENTLVEATGWASPTLLVLNATSSKESRMSFWFDVQTQKFIRLATYFN